MGLSETISETRSGFLKGRLVHNNIKLIWDLFDYRHVVRESGFILILHFYKAVDLMEHPFIIKTLVHFGLGEKFVNMLHNGIVQ